MRYRGGSRRGLASLGGMVGKSLEQLGIKGKVQEQRAVARWAEIVGSHIAASSAAESVREGVMFVSCKSSMWANELTLLKEDILAKYQKTFGRTVITDIRFSARGYKRASERVAKEEPEGEQNYLATVEASDQDLHRAEEVASHAGDAELAERIRKAVLTGRRRAEVQRRKGKDQQ